jgi:hypothetical protein
LLQFLLEFGRVIFQVEFLGSVGNGQRLEKRFGFGTERAVGFGNYGHDARF